MTGDLKIAVIEDDDELRTLVLETLTSHGHDAVGMVSAEGFDEQRVSEFDIFIVDLSLPGEDGLSLSRRIRDAHPLAGIVMVTGRARSIDKIAGYDSGADVYLLKPVLPDELVAVVGSIGRRLSPQQARDDGYERQPMLTLDTVRVALVSGHGVVELTPREAALVEALTRAPRRQLGLARIAEVLGLEFHNMSKASLEVRVVRLRRKLTEAGAAPPAIKAVRGYGYKLCTALTLA